MDHTTLSMATVTDRGKERSLETVDQSLQAVDGTEFEVVAGFLRSC